MKTVFSKHPRRSLSLVLIIAAAVPLLIEQFAVRKGLKPGPAVSETTRPLESVEPVAESKTGITTPSAANANQPQAVTGNREASSNVASGSETSASGEITAGTQTNTSRSQSHEPSKDLEERIEASSGE